MLTDAEADKELTELLFLLKDVPHAYLLYLKEVLASNDNTDWTRGVVRPSLEYIWPLFLSYHLVIGISGIVGSICMCIDVRYTRIQKNSTGIYLINLLILNILMLCIELPLNFLIMVYENWVFGMLICYFSAALPYILVHNSMLNFLMMAIDRYRTIAHPGKRQLNTAASLLTVWVISICAAMPVVTYIHFRDIGHIDARLKNNGFCWSTGDTYSRVVFVTIFTLPLVVLIFILMKTSAELKLKEEVNKVSSNLNEPQGSFNTDTTSSYSEEINSLVDEDIQHSNTKIKLWIEKEKITQRYLTMIIAFWVICWIPMRIFSVVSTNAVEEEDNAAVFDIVHMILTPISAISTITTPVCFIVMHRSLKRQPLLLAKKSNNCDISTTASHSRHTTNSFNNDEQAESTLRLSYA